MHMTSQKKTILIPLGNFDLPGDISIPPQAHALIIFAHGSGSSRLSSRNQMVAEYLNSQGMATFLFDLLTYAEDSDYGNRFNIPLLAQRLKYVTGWLWEQEAYKGLRTGYFGASTGAAAALLAARDLPEVAAVVSRGGRPDLALAALPMVKASTLLIVGSLDTDVIQLNERALAMLGGEKKMETIPGASHLFEEAGTMEKVCISAATWFEMHLHPLELID
jgi:dienelactone hydrolase